MSVASLTALAVERDLAPAGSPPMGGKRSTPTPAAGVQPDAAAAPGGVPQTFIDTLTSAIPTEPLVAYTAVIGIVTAVTDPSTGNYLPFRCWAAGVFVVLTAAAVLVSYRSKAAVASPAGPAATRTVPRPFRRLMIVQQGRAVPVPELISAVVAAAAWGAAMPGGPLSVAFTGPVQAITTCSTAVLGAVVVSFLAGQLTNGAGPSPSDGTERTSQGAAPSVVGAPGSGLPVAVAGTPPGSSAAVDRNGAGDDLTHGA
jgi:hypothetical protein